MELNRVMCFGDSNTWGALANDKGRFSSDVRWTGFLQKSLGDTFTIIEEGLPGRTVATKQPALAKEADGLEYFYHGGQYFYPCLMSHDPLDLVVIMLGTNDIKDKFNNTTEGIVRDLESHFLDTIEQEKHLVRKPNVLLVAPMAMNEDNPYVKKYFSNGNTKIQQLTQAYEALAKRRNIHFMSAFDPRYIGDDGLHFSKEGHALFATQVAQKILSILM